MTRLWVVVPAHQEAARIGATLDALDAQRDRDFTLLVVDNASTDATGDIIRRFARRAAFPVLLLTEPQKGVGCAVDTGFRYAIAHGAEIVARTDADCLPRPGWTAAALVARHAVRAHRTGPDARCPVEPAVSQLVFGAGPHACPGAPLARAQLRDTLSALAPYRPAVVRAVADRHAALPGWRTLTVRARESP